jgi:hypothetical protein
MTYLHDVHDVHDMHDMHDMTCASCIVISILCCGASGAKNIIFCSIRTVMFVEHFVLLFCCHFWKLN